MEWPENDYRIFVGDLGNETNDEVLAAAFNKYESFQKAKIVRDKRSNKTKGELLVFRTARGRRLLAPLLCHHQSKRACTLGCSSLLLFIADWI